MNEKHSTKLLLQFLAIYKKNLLFIYYSLDFDEYFSIRRSNRCDNLLKNCILICEKQNISKM